MSEMTSIVEQHQHQQQYASGGSSTNEKLNCKDCGMNFDSKSSLDVHLRYHQENLMSQWVTQSNSQEESNNNNTSKPGNHNSGTPSGHVSSVKHESITAPADSSEQSSRPPSEGAACSSTRIHQQQQDQRQSFNHHFATPMFNESQYFMHSDQSYMLSHHFSPNRQEEEDHVQRNQAANYARYHPYQHQQHFSTEQRTNSVSSTSPRSSPLQCEKCGAIYEDANQLSDHVRTNHPTSPNTNTYSPQQSLTQSSQSQQRPQQQPPQYQQLAASPQQQVTQSQQNQAQTQQQQMLASPSQTQSNQHQQQQQLTQQSVYDYPSGNVIKSEAKEPEEQAEILDLDSHKVQTHRYEEDFMRLQHQQEMHMQMQQQVMQQHQPRSSTHSVNSMLGWSQPAQTHDFHPGLSPMGPIDSVSPLQEQQTQFMRSQQQHLPSVESPRHPGSPIITSTQPMSGLPIPTSLMQQNPKPPPLGGNQSWKSNEARRPKTYNCTACNKWFTSSGHLKRHYNTTLHKNAVKQSNQPDPANLPISAHHHPGRDANSRGGSASRNSPELSSSSSPPNLMAGPSGEATRGLLNTPTNTAPTMFSNNNNSNSSSSEATAAQGQKSLQQQQIQQSQSHQAQQQQSSTVMLASNLQVYLSSPVSSPMGQQQSLHHQQMGTTSQLGQPQQQGHPHHHHLSMGSPSPIGVSVHHPMNSPLSPMQHQVHMNTPSAMDSGHHHMSSPSPIMAGVAPVAMASSPPGTMMGGITMPHQPHPNDLPPHVTTITSIPALLESITSQLTTTGNPDMHVIQSEMLPDFGSFNSHHEQKMLPSFAQFGNIANGFLVSQATSEAVNVGGLSPEENLAPQERTFESPVTTYDIYRNSPSQYDNIGGLEIMQITNGSIFTCSVIRHEDVQHQIISNEQHPQQTHRESQQQSLCETNNNLPHLPPKEELNPNIVKTNGRSKKVTVKQEKKTKAVTKEHQVTSTISTSPHYISVNGLHKCIECDKVFNKACYLTQHNKSFHSGDKPFKCNRCGKRFPHEYLHAEHLQKHAGEKPYKCEICPKQFNHKTDLRRHMCLHTGEKPYACTICYKGFIRKDHMMKHVETHKKKSNNYHKVHLRA